MGAGKQGGPRGVGVGQECGGKRGMHKVMGGSGLVWDSRVIGTIRIRSPSQIFKLSNSLLCYHDPMNQEQLHEWWPTEFPAPEPPKPPRTPKPPRSLKKQLILWLIDAVDLGCSKLGIVGVLLFFLLVVLPLVLTQFDPDS